MTMSKDKEPTLRIKKADVVDVKPEINPYEVSATPIETDANAYPLEVKIAGYCVRHANGKMEFIPKQKRKVVNGLVSVKQTDETTIKTNKNYVQVIITAKRKTFNFKKYMSILNEIYLNLKSLKLL